ncbi:HAD-IA family hydrolase [Rapidithrix thailandica]|uniref:HAD-IA family hydrolase n=1 Tax=Rapidithrix thailandica TaxID=413964 RepID=A0AAW9SEM1_9BACT
MSIKLVVFDMAGTTVKDKSNVGAAFKRALESFGYDAITDAEVQEVMGYEKPLAIKRLLEKHEPETAKITEELIAGIHQKFVDGMIRYYETNPEIGSTPNAEAVLKGLREQGIKVGINTGFSRDIAEAIVKRLQWREKGVFDCLVASDEVPQGRPYPDMIQKLMLETGVEDIEEVAKVGDTEVDVNEGKNAGCKYIVGVTTGAYSREELAVYGPTHIIDNLSELSAILADN